MAIKKKKSPQASSAATPAKKKKSAAVSPASKKKSSKKTSAGIMSSSESLQEEQHTPSERPTEMEPVQQSLAAASNAEETTEKPESGLPIKAIVLGAVLLAAFIFVAKDLIFPGKKESGNPPAIESEKPAPQSAAPAEAKPETAAPEVRKEQPAASGELRSYTVKPGDTVMKIAASQLGDAKRFNEILELNKDTLKTAAALKVGMTLKLPAK